VHNSEALLDRVRVRAERRSGSLRTVLRRALRLDRWHPQVPLAVAIGAFAVLHFTLAVLEGGRGELPGRWSQVFPVLAEAPLGRVGDAVLGGVLLIMAVGLVVRSRLAWVVVLVALCASLPNALVAAASGLGIPMTTFRIVLLVAVLAYRRRFDRTSIAAATLFATAALLAVLAYGTAGTWQLRDQFTPPIEDLTSAFYYTVITVSTVGYGDFIPQDGEARLFTVSLVILGLGVFATSVSTLLIPVIGLRLQTLFATEGRRVERSNHFIIVGDSQLARNTAEELSSRGQHVTWIMPSRKDEVFFKGKDVVIGDATDLSVLRAAGAEAARAVLALSDDDSENGFVVLGVNEISPSIMTVAGLNDGKNRNRIGRTQPSLVVSLQVLGGQLLAMALTGEKVDSANLLNQVFQVHGLEAPAKSGGGST